MTDKSVTAKFEPKENSGNLFRVDTDGKHPNAPPYEGEFKALCPVCSNASRGWIKAWIKETKMGKKYFSVALKFRDAPKS